MYKCTKQLVKRKEIMTEKELRLRWFFFMGTLYTDAYFLNVSNTVFNCKLN